MVKKLGIIVLLYFINIMSLNAYTAYKQGNLINYNGIDFYVLYDSLEDSNVLTLLKATPLTKDEATKYSNGNLNRYIDEYQEQEYASSEYAIVAYYSNDNCKFGVLDGTSVHYPFTTGCKYDYESSDIKRIVDAWGSDKLNSKDLWKDNLGYNYRLITKQEVLEYIPYKLTNEYYFSYSKVVGKTPEWFNDDNSYGFWTMTKVDKINSLGSNVKGVIKTGNSMFSSEPFYLGTIRPVVLLKKSALNKKNGVKKEEYNNTYENSNTISNTENKSDNLIVDVPDTYTKISLILTITGIILIVLCMILYLHSINKRGKNEKKN